jgi:hypothetical protein
LAEYDAEDYYNYLNSIAIEAEEYAASLIKSIQEETTTSSNILENEDYTELIS